MGQVLDLRIYTKDDLQFNYNYPTVFWDCEKGQYEYQIGSWTYCQNVRNLAYKVMKEHSAVDCSEINGVKHFYWDYETLEDFMLQLCDICNEKSWNAKGTLWKWKDIESQIMDMFDTFYSCAYYLKNHKDDIDTKIIFFDYYSFPPLSPLTS